LQRRTSPDTFRATGGDIASAVVSVQDLILQSVMMTSPAPGFRDLDFMEIEAMLKEHSYGRLAFTFRDRVDVEPIHYVYENGWLICRTAPGTKLTQLAHHPWVAFEIDEVRGLFEWRSVVVKGTVYLVERNGSAASEETWKGAVEALRRLTPAALMPDDPTPGRNVVFRIHIDEMHGRSAAPAGQDA
jgi:nitroimidazol reductase NimA-like FMN-containing flavoprotein (pyridoxamine 5'-phosphate oxidase superfamily)